MRGSARLLKLAGLLLCVLGLGLPRARAQPDIPSPLRVAVAGSAPFVVTEGEEDQAPHGLSMDIWRALAAHVPATARSQFVTHDSVEEALRAVERGEADVALGPISITSARASRVSFSQPYFRSALSIIAPVTESLWDRIKPFVSRAFIVGVALLLAVLAGVGTLLWLLERRVNPEQFPSSPAAGIANGVWLALVTMSTVGYGDLAPRTRGGRLVAGGWMIISMITASSFTASIATALTLSQLETPGIEQVGDLARRRIASIDGSPAAAFVRDAGGHVLRVPTVSAGIDAIRQGRADAMVWDRPVLAHHLQQHPESNLSLSQSEYRPRGYGIAVAHDEQALLQALDVGVLRLQESGQIERIASRWVDL